ncbi:MAG: DNA polymerase III subunit delta' [Candidatus Buchananbacteria bacterium RBG_13_36_9]|uniref:DNA polymerase III subunit delta' n=1 Tax=Candidatus Buchananbacteria bacterium RBG_13_36_9 TaxID=1797530 RepID=A0A1G1XM22_9BACT|nr:MAG: DNA polymerase III subunit delta' [Candidatus Buchananbacteria bacterium RBG_13_36_9]
MNKFNWPIVGHEKIAQFLQKSLSNNRLGHAYLFSGKAHLGKKLVARKFIASILCEDYHKQKQLQAAAWPCNECIFCQQLARGIHPDVFYLKKEDDKKNISVEQVREMHKFLSLTSFLNSYKIALIESAGDLSESAQNALLKILEEPAPKTMLILIAEDFTQLLPTIVSRCQVIKFWALKEEEIFRHLITLGANREQAKIFTALAGGQIGTAINFLVQPEYLNEYSEKMDGLLNLFSHDLTANFQSIESIFSAAKNPLEAATLLQTELGYWQLILRDILASKNNLDNLLVNQHYRDKIKNLALTYSTPKILEILNQIKKIKQYLNYNINPRLAAENLILSI